ncbi:MAG: DUF4337 domain-containing protein [Hyphomicrobiales bacterium]|nr:DUF4337 domain-containing protein [Hyphomicrobiales bacterium]
MKADEAAELLDRERETDRFKQRAAIVIAFFAMCLAITSLGGSNAAKEAFNNNILAANYFSFFQAKNIRQTSYQLAADELELGWLASPALPPEARKAMQDKIDFYKKTVARYESEPETREGKKELLERARQHEQARDHALRQDPYFDYAEALMQIAIVLISVSIVANLVWLAYLGGALGLIGLLLSLNGFLLLVEIPGLA